MVIRCALSRWSWAVMVACGVGGLPAAGQTPSAMDEPQATQRPAGGGLLDRFGFDVSLDYVSAYYYRGILQEDRNLIVQPGLGVSYLLADNAWQPTVSAGMWNSFHGAYTGASSDSHVDAWYEMDITLGLSLQPMSHLTMQLTYTAYISPNNAFDTVHEVALGVSYDDSAVWGSGFAINPHATLALEVAGSAFGPHEGVYLELGVTPSFTLVQDRLTLGLPVKAGLGLNRYYEAPQAGGVDDDVLGYVSLGAQAELSMDVLSPKLSGWSLRGGVEFLFLGSNLKAANRGGDREVILSLGTSLSF